MTYFHPKAIVGVAMSFALVCCSPANAESALVQDLQELAAEDNSEALYHLGMIYLLGDGVETDQEKAVNYFRQSASLGDPLAAYKLGCFYDGQYQLLEIDLSKALEFKLIAAEAGYALAQQDVASLFYRLGDTRQALNWIERAADQGTSGALRTYALLHNGAEGIEANPVITAAYFSLFLANYRASDEQREWLSDLISDLDVNQLEEVDRIVATYEPAPTPLTLKALSGKRAAQNLVSQLQ